MRFALKTLTETRNLHLVGDIHQLVLRWLSKLLKSQAGTLVIHYFISLNEWLGNAAGY
jgi:hypothetical protein